jgi:lipoprotein-anchoring transpeptidase ErfK/SrfK
MRNADIVDLFDLVDVGTLVVIEAPDRTTDADAG